MVHSWNDGITRLSLRHRRLRLFSLGLFAIFSVTNSYKPAMRVSWSIGLVSALPALRISPELQAPIEEDLAIVATQCETTVLQRYVEAVLDTQREIAQ